MNDDLKWRLLEFLEKLIEESKNRPRPKLFDISMQDGGKLIMDNVTTKGLDGGSIKAGDDANISITNSKFLQEDPYTKMIMELVSILKENELDKSKLNTFKSRFEKAFGQLPQALSIVQAITRFL